MTPLEISIYFDKIWSEWPNQEGEFSSKKAFEVAMKQGVPLKQLQDACRIYCLEHTGDEFTFKLSNFILRDEWKDVLEGADLGKLEQKRLDAIEVIEEWNTACRSHWCKVSSIEDRIPIAKKALANKAFNENWKISLDKCSKIFQYSFRDTDNRSKLNINFTWFANVTPDKHTVLRIMEGFYGSAQFSGVVKQSPKWKDMTNDERRRVMADFEDVFKKTNNERDIPEFD